MSKLPAILCIIIGLSAAPAMAKVELKDVSEISEGMITVGMADMIRKNCSSIKARMIAAALHVKGLERRAKTLGYSKAEIKSYVKNDTEKARLLGIARSRLQAKGVNLDQPKTYCTVGMAEINAGSPIGKLLKAN